MAQGALEGLSHNLSDFNDVVSNIAGFFKGNGEFKFEGLTQIPEKVVALINMRITAMGFNGKQAAAIRDYVIWDLLGIDDPMLAGTSTAEA